MQNAEKLSDGLDEAVTGLYGDDDSDGATALLTRAERALSRLGRFDDSLEALHTRVADLMYQVQDVAEELRDRRADFAYSGERLSPLSPPGCDSPSAAKYGVSCQDILDYLAKAQKELDEIEFADDEIARLKTKLQSAEQAAWEAAFALRKARQDGAERLAARILEELRQLDMPRVQFQCQFTQTELSPVGADAVAFYMSANVGEALKPMNKVASGGELARIMLALKNVLAQQDRWRP